MTKKQEDYGASKVMFTQLQPARASARARENRIPDNVYRLYFDGGGSPNGACRNGWVIRKGSHALASGSGVAMDWRKYCPEHSPFKRL